MPSKNQSDKKLYYIAPENIAQLKKRAPITGHNGGGSPNVNIPLNASILRYAAFCDAGLRRVWEALPEPQDRAFIRYVLMGIATDDVTLIENPVAYLAEIAEAAAEYEDDEPFTGALLPALRRFGPLEALALVDWIEQEKLKK